MTGTELLLDNANDTIADFMAKVREKDAENADLRKQLKQVTADRDMYNRTSTYWWREWHAASGRKRPEATDAGVNEACKRMDEQERDIVRLSRQLEEANAIIEKAQRLLELHVCDAPEDIKDYAEVMKYNVSQDCILPLLSHSEIEKLEIHDATWNNILNDILAGKKPEFSKWQHRDLVSLVFALLVRCNAMQAIVDKLPKTEDGVTILPGMELWHIEKGVEFADGSQAYRTLIVDWLGWHKDRRKRQAMYFSVKEEICDYYDGKDFFANELNMLKAIGDPKAIDDYLEEKAILEAAEAAKKGGA